MTGRKKESSSVNERQPPAADLLPSSAAVEAAWTGCDSCTPGCTPDPAPPDIYGWWSGAPWLGEGSGCFSNRRRCTGEEEEQRTRVLFKGFPTDTSQRPTSHG